MSYLHRRLSLNVYFVCLSVCLSVALSSPYRMHESGALRDGRAEWWLNFKWHHNLILHEAGVPPIHTPVSVLAGI